MLNKKHAMTFEKIEEQAREESPTKSERTREEVILGSRTKETKETLDWSQYEMSFPPEYYDDDESNNEIKNEVQGQDGKIQRIYMNGKKEVIFSNKVRRETYPNGHTIVFFNNGDIKQTYPDQKIVYYFKQAQTTQTTFADGLQVFKFQNKQIEKHYTDGMKEIK